MKTNIFALGLLLLATTGVAQRADHFFRAAGSPENPKVQASWNKYYTVAGIEQFCRDLVKAYPDLVKLESIGKSYEGREIWLLTITNHKNKPHKEKPGFYADGNIHSNEIQGSEFAMYTAWYLAEMYNSVPFIKELLDEKVFYIVPSINPDGREHFMKKANNMHTPRSGVIPVDDDKDGVNDDDLMDDLNGDGHITQMRRKNPKGRWRADPDDPRRLVLAPSGTYGEYDMLGFEGTDLDGDGRINEDRVGFYDPNRDWAWNWQPDYIQGGAMKYPFSVPENRAVADFVMKHPNIAGAQSYHNNGGMLLRGPGAEEDVSTYTREDVAVYDILGKTGEEMMPGYRYLTVYKDLYSVFGGELDWFYGGRGIYTFTNELWTSWMFFGRPARPEDSYKFDRLLLFGDAFVDWKPFKHPQYGDIEIGGFKKNFTRANPGFLLESDAHRNMAFTVFHGYHMPSLSIDEVSERNLGSGLREITVKVSNNRVIPTHSSHDLKYKITRPDYIILEGATPVAAMIVQSPDFNQAVEQKANLSTIEVANIPGMSSVTVRWIVKGSGKPKITVDSAKGGKISK